MEWASWEVGQLLLYVMALGVPSAWITGWLYRMWRKANMPAILGMISRQRRRDETIKKTRERAAALEALQEDYQLRLAKMEKRLQDFEIRVGKSETAVAQLRHRLRSRGLVTDA